MHDGPKNALADPVITAIAERHGKTPAQVVLSSPERPLTLSGQARKLAGMVGLKIRRFSDPDERVTFEFGHSDLITMESEPGAAAPDGLNRVTTRI